VCEEIAEKITDQDIVINTSDKTPENALKQIKESLTNIDNLIKKMKAGQSTKT
jgi:hypothetical protein